MKLGKKKTEYKISFTLINLSEPNRNFSLYFSSEILEVTRAILDIVVLIHNFQFNEIAVHTTLHHIILYHWGTRWNQDWLLLRGNNCREDIFFEIDRIVKRKNIILEVDAVYRSAYCRTEVSLVVSCSLKFQRNKVKTECNEVQYGVTSFYLSIFYSRFLWFYC